MKHSMSRKATRSLTIKGSDGMCDDGDGFAVKCVTLAQKPIKTKCTKNTNKKKRKTKGNKRKGKK